MTRIYEVVLGVVFNDLSTWTYFIWFSFALTGRVFTKRVSSFVIQTTWIQSIFQLLRRFDGYRQRYSLLSLYLYTLTKYFIHIVQALNNNIKKISVKLCLVGVFMCWVWGSVIIFSLSKHPHPKYSHSVTPFFTNNFVIYGIAC